MSSKRSVVPEQFTKILKHDERYVAHSYFTEQVTGTSCILILTDSNHYRLSTDNYSVVWCKSLLEIHSVEDDIAAPEAIRITYQTPLSKSKVGSTKLDKFLETKIYIASSPTIRDEWVLVLRALTRSKWQRLFESTYMPDPEVYQKHLFVNKINSKGRAQVRCVAFSTKKLYNMAAPESDPQTPGKVKWAFPYSVIKKIAHGPTSLVIYTDGSVPKLKPEIHFLFSSEKENEDIMFELKRLYKVNTGRFINEEKEGAKRIAKTFSFLYN